MAICELRLDVIIKDREKGRRAEKSKRIPVRASFKSFLHCSVLLIIDISRLEEISPYLCRRLTIIIEEMVAITQSRKEYGKVPRVAHWYISAAMYTIYDATFTLAAGQALSWETLKRALFRDKLLYTYIIKRRVWRSPPPFLYFLFDLD